MAEYNMFENRRIVLFGANNASKEMKEYLEQNKYFVEAVIDNDKRKWGQAPFGIMTYSPEDYLGEYDESYIVLIVSQYYMEMTAQLEKLGYKKDVHVFVVKKIFQKYDTSMEVFQKFAEDIQKGNEIYERIKMKYSQVFDNSDGRMYICPYAGTGDIYLIGQFFEQYRKEQGVENYIITVVGASCAKVGTMFDWKIIVELTQTESDCVLAYVRFAGLKETKTVILNDCYQQVVNRRIRGHKGVNFRVMFQKVVFGLETKERFICREQAIIDSNIKKYAEEKGMIAGRTVIIAPYANTISNIDIDTWEYVVNMLKEKGYVIYTNCLNEVDVVSGTRQLFAPFSYMKQLVEYAGTFIGVRSGLCDIIGSAQAKKIILYPAGMLFGACSTYDYFSLNKMGYCLDAVEIEYHNSSCEELISFIQKMVGEEIIYE